MADQEEVKKQNSIVAKVIPKLKESAYILLASPSLRYQVLIRSDVAKKSLIISKSLKIIPKSLISKSGNQSIYKRLKHF